MNYEVFRLRFETGIHIGSGKLSTGENIIMADTLFSALCQEAVMLYGEEGIEKLVKLAMQGKILITDAMPVNKDTYYIPKPMLRIESGESGNSSIKKEFKKLKYIEFGSIADYVNGTLNPAKEREKMNDFGKFEVRTMASVTEGQDARPYPVGVFRYGEGWGLYFILGYEGKDSLEYIKELLMSLELSGIGGKRSSGLGKFTLENANLPEEFEKRLCTGNGNAHHMTLSISMASNDELENVLAGASYSMIRRSGFVASYTFAETLQRKKDLYMFSAGSTFKNTFTGIIEDVSPGGAHPVYKYGKPLFLEVTK